MWEYIITWCLIAHVSMPCNNSSSEIDEYGRRTYYECLAYHFKTESDCEHKKIFLKKDSAITFYKNISKERRHGDFADGIDEIKMDSILYKKNN